MSSTREGSRRAAALWGFVALLLSLHPPVTTPATASLDRAPPMLPEPIYRLHISISTTAETVRLSLLEPAILIEAEPRTGTGRARATFDGYGDGPLRLDSRGGNRSRATFLVAVTPGGAHRFRWRSRQQGAGETTIAFTNQNRLAPVPIERVRQDEKLRRLSLGLDRVANRGPVAGTEPLPPSVLAFYYGWYNVGDWTGARPMAADNTNPTPYGSDDPVAIARHLQQATSAGIEGFIVSWLGRDTPSDQNLPPLIQQMPPEFRFAIYLEMQHAAFQTQEDVVEEIAYALDTYASDPHYLRFQGKPVLYAFATRHILQGFSGINHQHLATWRAVLDTLRARGYDFYLVGEGRRFTAENFSVFDGMHSYGTEDPAGHMAFSRERGLIARAYAAIHGGLRRTYAGSILPGYDDRHIPDREATYYFPRRDGELYGEQWDVAIRTASDVAVIVSFNEWMETSNIEPSAQFGTKYLELTLQHATAFRASR